MLVVLNVDSAVLMYTIIAQILNLENLHYCVSLVIFECVLLMNRSCYRYFFWCQFHCGKVHLLDKHVESHPLLLAMRSLVLGA